MSCRCTQSRSQSHTKSCLEKFVHVAHERLLLVFTTALSREILLLFAVFLALAFIICFRYILHDMHFAYAAVPDLSWYSRCIFTRGVYFTVILVSGRKMGIFVYGEIN